MILTPCIKADAAHWPQIERSTWGPDQQDRIYTRAPGGGDYPDQQGHAGDLTDQCAVAVGVLLQDAGIGNCN